MLMKIINLSAQYAITKSKLITSQIESVPLLRIQKHCLTMAQLLLSFDLVS